MWLDIGIIFVLFIIFSYPLNLFKDHGGCMNSDHCERTCINGGQAAAEARIVGPVLAVGAEDAVAGDALVPLTQQTRQQKVVSLE